MFEGEAAPVDAPEDAGGALLEAEDPAEVALAEPDPEEVIDRELEEVEKGHNNTNCEDSRYGRTARHRGRR